MGNMVEFANIKRSKEESERLAFEKKCDEAYEWMLTVQRNNEWYAQAIRLIITGDVNRTGKCTVCLFVNQEGKAILFRKWTDTMRVQFDRLLNLDEVKEKMGRLFPAQLPAHLSPAVRTLQ